MRVKFGDTVSHNRWCQLGGKNVYWLLGSLFHRCFSELLVEALLLRLEQRLITYDDFKRGPIDGKAHRVLTPITVGMEVHMNNTRGRSLRLDAPSANANGLIQIRSDVHYHRV